MKYADLMRTAICAATLGAGCALAQTAPPVVTDAAPPPAEDRDSTGAVCCKTHRCAPSAKTCSSAPSRVMAWPPSAGACCAPRWSRSPKANWPSRRSRGRSTCTPRRRAAAARTEARSRDHARQWRACRLRPNSIRATPPGAGPRAVARRGRVAGRDTLRLCIAVAADARRPALVLYAGRRNEHRQCAGLSAGRAAHAGADASLWTRSALLVGGSALASLFMGLSGFFIRRRRCSRNGCWPAWPARSCSSPAACWRRGWAPCTRRAPGLLSGSTTAARLRHRAVGAAGAGGAAAATGGRRTAGPGRGGRWRCAVRCHRCADVAGARLLVHAAAARAARGGRCRRFSWRGFAPALAGYAHVRRRLHRLHDLRRSRCCASRAWARARTLFYALLGLAVHRVVADLGRPARSLRGGQALANAERAAGVATLLPALTARWLAVLLSGLVFGAVFLSVVASTTALVRHNLPPTQWAPASVRSPSCSPSGRSSDRHRGLDRRWRRRPGARPGVLGLAPCGLGALAARCAPAPAGRSTSLSRPSSLQRFLHRGPRRDALVVRPAGWRYGGQVDLHRLGPARDGEEVARRRR